MIKKILDKIIWHVQFVLLFLRFVVTGRKCRFLLVDTPEYGNLGDHAIAVAEEQMLNQLGLSWFEISGRMISGREKLFAAFARREQCVLLQGGGFIGTLWPDEELRVQQILEAFSRHRVIILPQTVYYGEGADREDNKTLLKDRRLIKDNANITICLREKKSVRTVEELFPEVDHILVPDMALSLEVGQFAQEREGAALCFRNDAEKVLTGDEERQAEETLRKVFPAMRIERITTVVDRRVPVRRREVELNRLLAAIARKRLVITDRLHGMILCAVTGTPCIAFDNANGKVRSVYEWLKDLSYIQFARSVEDLRKALNTPELLKAGTYPLERMREKYEPLVRHLSSVQVVF